MQQTSPTWLMLLLMIAGAIALLTWIFALLTNPKTRPYLLAFGGVGLVLALLFFGIAAPTTVSYQPTQPSSMVAYEDVRDGTYVDSEMNRYGHHMQAPPAVQHTEKLDVIGLSFVVLLILGALVLILNFVKSRPLALRIVGVAAVVGMALVFIGLFSVRSDSMMPATPVAEVHLAPRQLEPESARRAHQQASQELVDAYSPSNKAATSTSRIEASGEAGPNSDKSEPDSKSAVVAVEENEPATAKRPAWIDRPATREQAVAKIGPYSSMTEIQQNLHVELARAVDAHAKRFFGVPIDFPHWRRMQPVVPVHYIYNSQIANADGGEDEVYVEERKHSFGNMYTMHVRLNFSRSGVPDQIAGFYKDAVLEQRMACTAILAMLALSLVGTVFGYLKLDTATKGYYTRRLQVAAAAVTLLFLASGGYLLAVLLV